MTESFNDKKIEHGPVTGCYFLYRPNDLIIGYPVHRIRAARGDLYSTVINIGREPMFLISAKMVDGRIDHNFSNPAFEGAHQVTVRRCVPVDLFENF